MNIIAIWLVLEGTKPGVIVMCKILTVVVGFYLCASINSTFLGCDSLPLILIKTNINMYIYSYNNYCSVVII